MQRARTTTTVVAVALAMAVACDRGGDAGGSGAGTTPPPAAGEQGGGEAPAAGGDSAAQRLVGTWANANMPQATMTFASNGRVRTAFGPCVGTYSIDGDMMTLDYEDSPNCSDMTGRVSFPAADQFSMAMTTYNRVDSTDDTSF